MIFKYLKKMVGGDEKKEEQPASSQFYSPLRIALHSTIHMQLVDLVLLDGIIHKHLTECVPPFNVNSIGYFPADVGTVYRVYMTDTNSNDYILQMLVGSQEQHKKEGGYEAVDSVSEVILFRQVVSEQPTSEASWDRCLADIGFETLELDGNKYYRAWGDRYTEKASLLHFSETVVEKTKNVRYDDHYLLYTRSDVHPTNDNLVQEYLLVGIEESDESAELVMQVGIPLALSDIEVV